MEEQSYAKHARYVPLFHYTLVPIAVLTLLTSVYNLVRALGNGSGRLTAGLITALSFAMVLVAWFSRFFALKAQDRAIRVEENLRHFAMTGKLLDKRLSVSQIIGLRFASDAEFPALAQRAADENLSLDSIKKSVRNWKADTDRM